MIRFNTDIDNDRVIRWREKNLVKWKKADLMIKGLLFFYLTMPVSTRTIIKRPAANL